MNIRTFSKRSLRLKAALTALSILAVGAFAQSATTQQPGTRGAGSSQDVYSGATFTGGTERVVLHTTVVDRNDRLITDLTQKDFRVLEDDAEQKLTLFRREDVPVSVGILVDNSGSMLDKRVKVNTAALDFVKSSNPEDEVFIVNFNDEAFLDSPFTRSQDRLQDALQRIDARGGTALYDATGMSLDYLLEEGKWPKKLLLVISDGEDNASRSNLEDLVRRLQETDTMIYAVGLLSEEDRRSAKRARRAIRNITRATGGAAYFPGSIDELHALTQQIAHDIRNQYIIEYRPDEAKPPGFRRIKIELLGKAKRYDVRHRPGYYAN